MRVYVIRKIFKAIPILMLITMIGFLLVRFNIVESIMRELLLWGDIGGENIEEYIEEQLGLNEPLMVQYGRWLGVVPQKNGEYSGLLQGDLGESLWR